ncbi:MAG: four helix bundle protein [Patescibacteria group bacterium]
MESKPITSYKDLIVWQKAIGLVVAVYELTEQFPKSEIYGLASQMRRAVISIPSNIAEGRRRGTRKDFCHFLFNAFGSGSELETQIEIVKVLPFGKKLDYEKIDKLLNEVMRMLNRLISNLQAKT